MRCGLPDQEMVSGHMSDGCSVAPVPRALDGSRMAAAQARSLYMRSIVCCVVSTLGPLATSRSGRALTPYGRHWAPAIFALCSAVRPGEHTRPEHA